MIVLLSLSLESTICLQDCDPKNTFTESSTLTNIELMMCRKF